MRSEQLCVLPQRQMAVRDSYRGMWRHPKPTERDLDEIAKRLRLLGCTEEQVHRHLVPLQSVSRSSVNRRSYSEADEFTVPLATGRDDEGLLMTRR